MASRKEQKERLREERLAAEKAQASAQARNRRIQYALGALIAAAAAVGIVIAVTSGGGGGSKDGSPEANVSTAAKLPAVKDTNLASAAKAAGCVLKSPAIEGYNHITSGYKYDTNPPTSGDHNPDPALDGVYDAGNEPAPEHYVHTLEHGRIEIQYKPGTSAAVVSKLVAIYNEPLSGMAGYKTLVFQNNTKMPYAVAATSWGQMLGCKTYNDKVLDAIRDFRVKYVDKGRENIPPNNMM